MIRMRRIVVTVVIAASILMASAAPALAHTVAGTGATNYKTTLRHVSPHLPGLSVKVIEAGSRLQASYSGRGEVVVQGYQGEPYLRIGDKGVFQNLKSPATYINKTRNGTNPPADADPATKPVWQKISSGHVARWHDHRIHFMGGVNPPPVRNSPGTRHAITDWNVTITKGATTVDVGGDLVWVPGPSPAPMLLLALVLLGAMIAIGRRRSPFVAVALATTLLVAIDVVHSLAIGFANAGSVGQQLGRTFAGATVSIPAWLVGAGAVWLLLHKKVDGFFAAVFCGLIVAVVGGIADSTVLSRSQVPFALSAAIARPIVAASLGLGVGVAVAGGLAIRQLEPRVLAEDDE
ncbi:MAG: hypothetical protein QOJ00_853 [Actinomycetota bacterium]|jgi:hypothetical protein